MSATAHIDQLLSRWREHQARGEDVPIAELCRDCPELIAEVERRLHQLAPMEPSAEPATVAPGAVAGNETAALPPAPGASHRSAPAPQTVAGYEILGELGRGGMGVVYKARQTKLDRIVALKMILAGGHAAAAELERFRTEAEAIARLQHPNIVQIHEVGEQNGLPYFSLEFCAGGSLEKKLSGTPLPPADAAALVETLARAMAHAHGVVHRDLKPANILLAPLVHDSAASRRACPGGPDGGDQPRRSPASSLIADYIPKITDFGLAKKLDEAGKTATGAVMGTPSYMAPEQAGGKTTELGPACDVYALGAILYECLTGRPPFKAATTLDTLVQVMSAEPVPPTQLNAKVPRDLETICLKCLRKEPARRYAGAAALAEDLRRFQAGEPIRARPVGKIERAAKWANRHRALTALGVALIVGSVVVMLVTCTGIASVTWQYQVALKAAEDEKKARDHAEDLLATSTMMLARSRFEENQPSLADELLEQVPGKFRSSGWGLLKISIQGSLFTLPGHTFDVTSVAFAADGRVLASASWDCTVKLWDARTGTELRTLRGHKGNVMGVAFAADGQVLASASVDGTVKLWDARTGTELRTLRGHKDPVITSVAFAPDGQVLASASRDQTVKLWDARTGIALRTLRGASAPLAFAADGQVLASASADNTVKLWDARTGQELHTLRGHMHPVQSVAFSANGQVLASASADHTVKLWDTRTGQELRTLPGHTDRVNSVAFGADGQLLASGSDDNTVKLWDARTGRELRTLRGHTDRINSVAFAADGQLLASGSSDKTVKLWDARTGPEFRTLRGHKGSVPSVAFTADGRVLALASGDKTVKLWDARTGKELRTLPGHTDRVNSVAFGADGQVLASASSDRTVKLWDARTGQELHTLRGHTIGVNSVAFAADGQVLASASGDGRVILWDARTGQKVRSLLHLTVVASVAFAADGQLLASASDDGRVMLWDARTGQELHTLRGHTISPRVFAAGAGFANLPAASSVHSVAFAGDGQLLASASDDRTVKLWDARTGQELRTLRGHTDSVTSVTFAADVQVLASASADGTVKLWDVRTDQEPEKERRFRLWVTAPDLQLHREFAVQAAKDKQPFALAFRLGRYLAAKNYYAANPKDELKPPFSAPTFPDGIACTGVLYKDSGIAPARLLIGTLRALEGDPASWLNHALHGGALYRNGEHANALAALTQAVKLHGKPSPLTHHFLALTLLAMGQTGKAKETLAEAPLAKDALWEDVFLQRLLQPEIDAALAKGQGGAQRKEK